MENENITQLAATYQALLTFGDNQVEAPSQDENGNVRLIVTSDGLSFFFMFNKQDSSYVRILLPNFFALDLDDDKVNALVAMNHVACLCKVAKLNLNDTQNNTIASIEYLDHGSSVNVQIIERYLNMLINAVKEFIKKMRALKKEDEDS